MYSKLGFFIEHWTWNNCLHLPFMLYVCFSLSYFLRKMLISRDLIKGDWDGVLSVDVKNELLHNALNSRLQYAYHITKPWNCWWFGVCSVVHFQFSKSIGSCNLGRLLLEVDDILCLMSVPLQILVDCGKCIELVVYSRHPHICYIHTQSFVLGAQFPFPFGTICSTFQPREMIDLVFGLTFPEGI